jgi:hypothetical protein
VPLFDGVEMKKESYTSAGSYPLKLLKYVSKIIEKGAWPIHAVVCPTNQCNLNCKYCSCKGENRELSLNRDQLNDTLCKLYDVVDAITIAGGGEPLMLGNILEEAVMASPKHIELGMVSNGIRSCTFRKPAFWDRFNWIRLSVDSDRKMIPRLPFRHDGLAYSYVWRSGDEDDEKLLKLIDMAAQGKITHLRVVSDILNDADGQELDCVANNKLKYATKIPSVIFQPRHLHRRGAKKCYLPAIKPIIMPDGVYACCGAQYAINGKEGKMAEELKVGNDITEYMDRFKEPGSFFDGSICDKCYYWGYNELLDLAFKCRNVCHPQFV